MFKMKLLNLTNFIQLEKGRFYNKIIFGKIDKKLLFPINVARSLFLNTIGNKTIKAFFSYKL